MDIVEVIVPVSVNILYNSFYIQGLEKLFGRNHVKYSNKPFEGLKDQLLNEKSMQFVIRKGNDVKRYVVACDDSYEVDETFYDWCDVYGSVNANFAKTPERFHSKLVPLCPSFGVRCWNVPYTLAHALWNFPKTTSLRKYLGKHKRMLQRPLYSDYSNCENNIYIDNYIFFISTLWYNDEWNRNDEGVNLRRATFIRACRQLDEVVFEGGLVSQGSDRSSESLFADCLSKQVPMKEWMEKTKRSVLVFNTPAFWNCHGWKLGEYLAMGKCILSTKLSNDLPAPLEHGKSIHFVDDDVESIKDSVRFIVNHPDYRKKLETEARTYWNQYGSPVASLKLMGIEA